MRVEYVQTLHNAVKNRIGIGAFNIFNYSTAKAVITEAEEKGVAVIIQTSVKTVVAYGVDDLGKMLRMLRDNAKTDVFINLDHCKSISLAKDCIDNGWDAVMIDNSHLPIEENITITKEIVEYAHERNVAVEGELGIIAGVEDDIVATTSSRANLEDSLRFIKETNVDTFAPSIGTAHGIYTQKPQIDFKLVQELSKASDCPVVIHGGSGLPEEIFQLLIEKGAAKINVSTAIKRAYLDSAKEYFEVTQKTDPLALDSHTYKSVTKTVREHIEMFTGRP